MPSFTRITILGPSPWPRFFAAGCGRKTSDAPSAPRMAHRVHYRAACVRPDVRHVVRDAVRGKSLPECSFLAAGARPIRIPARAAARLLRKAATGLRALGLKPASLLRKAQASLPVPRSHRAPAGQGQKQNPRGGRRRKLACERSAKTFPKTPAARPAPDWRPIPSLRSVITQAASRARCALDEAPHRSRLGALPPLALAGARACFCRDRLSQRWGASFSLLRLGASHHGSPALGGPAQTFALGAKVFCHCSVAWATAPTFALGNTQRCLPLLRNRAAGARPIQKPNLDQTRSTPGWCGSTVFNPPTKARPTQFKARSNV